MNHESGRCFRCTRFYGCRHSDAVHDAGCRRFKPCSNREQVEFLNELWRLGWDFPTDSKGLRELGRSFDKAWRKAVQEGRAPDEDVSPGESFIYLAGLIDGRSGGNAG